MSVGTIKMDHEDVTTGGIVGVIVTAVGSIGGGIWWLVSKIRATKRVDDKTAIGYYKQIIDKMEQRQDLLIKQIQDSQASLAVLQQRCNDCDIDNEALHGWVDRKYEEACANYESTICMIDLLEKLGHAVPLKPKQPTKPPERRNREDINRTADYQRRTNAQNEQTLSQLDSKIKDISKGLYTSENSS